LKIAGIVLAGGLSKRMGQDKAQLALQRQSLLARAVDLLESVELEHVFVSGDYPPYSCILDIHPQLGPLAGLHACVNSLYGNYDALFILPVDMPLLTESECHSLLDAFAIYPQGVFYREAIFPMILPLDLDLKNYLSEAVTAKGKKQRSIYRLLTIRKVQALSYPQVLALRFQNSNTPEQWAHCLAIYNHLQQDKDKP
jgi:molybdopterin-guanine dinucleotide biosynthesis protein A